MRDGLAAGADGAFTRSVFSPMADMRQDDEELTQLLNGAKD